MASSSDSHGTHDLNEPKRRQDMSRAELYDELDDKDANYIASVFSLTARIEELEEALRPFVQAAAVVEEDNFPDEYPVHATRGGDGEHLYQLTAGHFRTALKALKP